VQVQQILLSRYDDPVFCDLFVFLKHLFSTFPTLYRLLHFKSFSLQKSCTWFLAHCYAVGKPLVFLRMLLKSCYKELLECSTCLILYSSLVTT